MDMHDCELRISIIELWISMIELWVSIFAFGYPLRIWGYLKFNYGFPKLIIWMCMRTYTLLHDDVIKWEHFPRYWPFVRGTHRSPVNSPHKGQWRGALMFSLICGWINGWVNNRKAGDLRRYRGHYDVNVMCLSTVGILSSDLPALKSYGTYFTNTLIHISNVMKVVLL